MKTEDLSEGWVKFKRLHFEQGFIDRWQGDVIDNPNNDKKKPFGLNATGVYYRLNGKGVWISSRKFKPDMMDELRKPLPINAVEFWAHNLI